MNGPCSKGIAAAAIALFFARAASAQTPSLAPMTVPQILARMAANTAGLRSYAVPVHIDAHVRNGLLSVPVSMDGERYFEAPAREAMRMRNVPAIGKQFSNVYAGLGTPQTWQTTYDIVLDGSGELNGHSVFRLRATYKHPSTVDRVELYVDVSTFDAVEVRWFYHNGATIVMDIDESLVEDTYRLPQRETLRVQFPAYSGNATVSYGTYSINVPIPDSVFGGSSSTTTSKRS